MSDMRTPIRTRAGGGPLAGTSYLLRGLPLLRQPGVWPWAVIPFVINVVLLGVLGWASVRWIGGMVDGWLAILPDWLSWLSSIVNFILIAAVILGVFQIFTLMANLIASPFNGFLSAAIEEKLTGKRPETGLSLWQEGLVTFRNELGKLWFLLTRAALVALLSIFLFIIPGLNMLLPVVWFLFGAYMLSLEYLDYPMGNHGLTFSEKRRLLASNRMLTLGFGATTTLLTTLPLINLLIIPTAVAGGTLAWVERLGHTRPNTDKA